MRTPSKRSPLLLLGVFAFLVCVSPPSLQAWQFDQGTLRPVSLNGSFKAFPSSSHADFNQDGQAERIDLSDYQVSIYAHSEFSIPLWSSPEDWQVQQALIADLNHDNQPELVLLIWRPFQPWPIDSFLPHGGRIETHQNRAGMSCHLVLIGWRSGQFVESWAGSALARPLGSIAAADLDGDGKQELITLESRYNDPGFQPARSMAVWRWNGFGFDLLARREGSYHSLAVVTSAQQTTLLLTQ